MALSIIKADPRGVYRMIAEHDLYLDESQQKVIVVKEGEEVPKEAAFVLAGRGGTIPSRYADLLKQLEVKDEVKAEVKAEAKVKAKPELPKVEETKEQ